MCTFIKMIAFSRVHLHQNDCFFSYTRTSKCLLFLLCTSIKMIAFSRVRLYLIVCFYFKVVAFSRVRLNHFFSCSCVCLHQNVCLYLCGPVSKNNACLYSCPLLSSFYVIVRMYSRARFLILYFYTNYKRSLPLLP